MIRRPVFTEISPIGPRKDEEVSLLFLYGCDTLNEMFVVNLSHASKGIGFLRKRVFTIGSCQLFDSAIKGATNSLDS